MSCPSRSVRSSPLVASPQNGTEVSVPPVDRSCRHAGPLRRRRKGCAITAVVARWSRLWRRNAELEERLRNAKAEPPCAATEPVNRISILPTHDGAAAAHDPELPLCAHPDTAEAHAGPASNEGPRRSVPVKNVSGLTHCPYVVCRGAVDSREDPLRGHCDDGPRRPVPAHQCRRCDAVGACAAHRPDVLWAAAPDTVKGRPRTDRGAAPTVAVPVKDRTTGAHGPYVVRGGTPDSPEDREGTAARRHFAGPGVPVPMRKVPSVTA